MSLYKTFKTDKGVEVSGVILDYGKNKAGLPVTIRIARAGGANTRYAKLVEAKTKPYRRQIQNDTLDPGVAEGLLREVYAEAVVLGWENVEDENGKPLPFNKENCIKVLNDLPDLYADIRDQAGKIAIFRSDILESDAGN